MSGCIWDTVIENIEVGSKVGIISPNATSYHLIDWGVKLEKKDDCPYNVAMQDGRLLNLPDGTEVVGSR